MRHRRFTKAQIIGMIKEQEAGMPTAEVCRTHGLNLSDTHRRKSLDGETAKLTPLLADTMLDNVVLKDLPGKT